MASCTVAAHDAHGTRESLSTPGQALRAERQ